MLRAIPPRGDIIVASTAAVSGWERRGIQFPSSNTRGRGGCGYGGSRIRSRVVNAHIGAHVAGVGEWSLAVATPSGDAAGDREGCGYKGFVELRKKRSAS